MSCRSLKGLYKGNVEVILFPFYTAKKLTALDLSVLSLDLVAKHGQFDVATHILSSDDLECTFAKLKTFCSDRQPGPVRVLSTLKILMLSKHHGIHGVFHGQYNKMCEFCTAAITESYFRRM